MIYADNAATTRISDKVFEQMLPFLREQYGNASSQYSFGVKARRAIDLSRRQVSDAIGSKASEITFTSGGSEGNSWVLQSIIALYAGEPIHIVTSSIEHHSILNTCVALERRGISVTYLPVDNNGYISAADVELALRPETKLVSIMLANNEIGTILPIAEIGEMLGKRNILFHTDAVQAVGHIPVNVNDLQVDLLTASAHKFNGAKGTGFIYIRSGLSLPPLVFGGKQEHGNRSGTENVAGIVALGYALKENISNMSAEREKQTLLVRTTVDALKRLIPNIQINAETALRLPGTVNITFPNASGDSIMQLLDLKRICVSTSSACHASTDKASHVLLALGLTEKQAKSSIRISYGICNKEDDAEKIAIAIAEAYNKIKLNLL